MYRVMSVPSLALNVYNKGKLHVIHLICFVFQSQFEENTMGSPLLAQDYA